MSKEPEIEIEVETTKNDNEGGNETIKNRERKQIERISGRILLNLIIVFFSVFLDMMGVSVVQPGINIYARLIQNINTYNIKIYSITILC